MPRSQFKDSSTMHKVTFTTLYRIPTRLVASFHKPAYWLVFTNSAYLCWCQASAVHYMDGILIHILAILDISKIEIKLKTFN
jgi:hypothetical protein